MQRGHTGKTDEILYAGTIGQGVHRSRDGGEHWEAMNFGLPPHGDVRALAVHPEEHGLLFAGTDHGCFRSLDDGLSWKPIRAIDETIEVWSLYICPQDPHLMFAGTRPARLYGSRDGGQSWAQLSLELPTTTRVTGIAVDPEDTDTVYLGIEVGGLLRSVDGGRRWETINEGLSDPDVHCLCVSASSPPTLHVATASDIFRSNDWGEHWQALRLKDRLPMTYFRAILVAPDNQDVLYATSGVAPFGEEGALYRSTDMGETWKRFDEDIPLQSTLWTVTVNPLQPRHIFAGTLCGQFLRTYDGGRTWQEFSTGFEDLRVLVCVPVQG
jgi:photosystem II stability/assembly factor-like uncharacterized protein